MSTILWVEGEEPVSHTMGASGVNVDFIAKGKVGMDADNCGEKGCFKVGMRFSDEGYTPPEEPVIEVDFFDSSVVLIELVTPTGERELIELTGSSTMHVFFEGSAEGDADDDGNGLDEVPIEMVEMELVGMSSSLGQITLSLNPSFSSAGQYEERENNISGLLDIPPFTMNGSIDSFFDVFIDIDTDQGPLYPADSINLVGLIHHKPPDPRDTYNDPDLGITLLELLDAVGNPSGYFISAFQYKPNSGIAT